MTELNLNHLGHNFVIHEKFDIDVDLLCVKCNVKIWFGEARGYIQLTCFKDEETGFYFGKAGKVVLDRLKLTCKEMIIKGIIE